MKFHTGIVEDRQDPLELGRVRVRVHNVHTDKKNQIATPDLPWSNVMSSTHSSSISGVGFFSNLVEGTIVLGFFNDSNETDFIVMGTLNSIPSSVIIKEADGTTVSNDPSNGFCDPRRSSRGDYAGTPDGSNPGHNPTRSESLKLDLINSPKRPDECDPDEAENFPLDEYLEESSVNKMARGEKTWVHLLKEVQIKGYEPKSPYDSKYPFNRILETESGHYLELDDTPGKERVSLNHRRGTFFEFHHNRDSVWHTMRDHYTTHERDTFEWTGFNRTVNNKKKTYIESNADEEKGWDPGTRINPADCPTDWDDIYGGTDWGYFLDILNQNYRTEVQSGDSIVHVKHTKGRGGSNDEEYDMHYDCKVGGNYTLIVNNKNEGKELRIEVHDGEMNVIVDHDINIETLKDANITVSGNAKIDVKGNTEMNVDGQVDMNSGKDFNIKSDGNVNITGASIFLNN